MTRQSLFALAITALFTAACGGSSPASSSGTVPAAGQTVVVTTAPGETSITPGTAVRFTAQVTGTADTTVRWSVDEADGGTIDATGLYTAPAIEGTFHVTAEQASQVTAAGTPTTSATKKGAGKSVIHVSKNAQSVAVTVSPGTATIPAGGLTTFVASVTGAANVSVVWTVQEGSSCGSVSPAGVYTAPGTGATCTVVATSNADTTRTGSAVVTVTPPTAPSPSAIAISISPTTVALDACKGQIFTASVTNSSNTAATWTITEAGGGTVTAGSYVAPTTPGTYHVVAASQADPSKTATATVTVGAEKVLSVAVTPGSGTVNANGAMAFAANVTTTCGTFAAQ